MTSARVPRIVWVERSVVCCALAACGSDDRMPSAGSTGGSVPTSTGSEASTTSSASAADTSGGSDGATDAADTTSGNGPTTTGTTGEPIGKPFPRGIYHSAGPLLVDASSPVANTPGLDIVDGVLVRVPWNLCDRECLLAEIAEELDIAAELGTQVALAVGDGPWTPAEVLAACTTIDFEFQGPRSMCVAWDPAYLEAKLDLVVALGAAFDDHPALASSYFTGACSTNGFEGHCRIDESAYAAAGYTPDVLAGAYVDVMDAYLAAFPTTPVVFEVHGMFDTAGPWPAVWDHVAETGHVGVAAWWCAERLSVAGHDTPQVWPIVREAADTTFTVCQTVANFSEAPWQFSDAMLGLDYGMQGDFDDNDVQRAFAESFDWFEGLAVHAGQDRNTAAFDVVEAWTVDLQNPAFTDRLTSFPD